MALNEREEAKTRELLAAYEGGKRIGDLEETTDPGGEARIEVECNDGTTRRMRLADALSQSENPIAGRWWDETNATPTAGGWYGSLDALKKLPETLGLGRYLVTDDRQMKKLDPQDSRRYADGSPAKLDGSEGQCMWCWNRGWYYTTWMEGNKTVEAITLKPLLGKRSQYIPAGGVSWLGVGVMDRETGMLCSLISEDERYRGGHPEKDEPHGECQYQGTEHPQWTLLGMAATEMSTSQFGEAARLRGEGWEANWFAARSAVEILLRIIMGTRNSQADWCDEPDEDGLRHGGFGMGLTEYWDWCCLYPVLPTSVGVDEGDLTGIINYRMPEPQADYYLNVPMFYGLVCAGFGNLWQWVRGLTRKWDKTAQSNEVYVAPSLYAGYDPDSVAGMKKVADVPADNGWIKRISMEGLCSLPTEYGADEETGYCDWATTGYKSQSSGLFVRCAGGSADDDTGAGASYTSAHYTATDADSYSSAPLCFFTEDVIIE